MTFRSGLQYELYGAPGGFPVVLHHGLAGSATIPKAWDDAARAQTIELIAVARPGYGESKPVEMASIADWKDLVAPVLDELDIDTYGVWGVSAGAPYAYALAALDRDRVTAVAVTSGLGYLADRRAVAMYEEPSRQLFEYFRTAPFDDVCRYWRDAWDPSVPGLRDSLAHDGAGPGREAVLQQRPWGFELATITAPVRMWHSPDDDMVPWETARFTQNLIPDAILQQQADPEHVPSRDTVRAALVFLTLRAQYPAAS